MSESDWKVFRELHKVALERLCTRSLAELKAEIERPGKASHEKWVILFRLVDKRDKDIARAFNDFRRSAALIQAGVIYSMGLFTTEEVRRFSPETQQAIQVISGVAI